MPLRACELVDDLAVPIETEPRHPLEDRVDRSGRGALAICILDTQVKHPALVAREEPIEERGPRPSDMQEAGGRGSKTGNDGHRSSDVRFEPVHSTPRCSVWSVL